MERIEKRSSAEIAADRLRDAIVLGDLEMGKQLSEGELGEMLGVSRTPIREALRLLNQEGLVQLTPYRGASVFRLTSEQLYEVIDFRRLIECEALSTAMAKNQKFLIKSLEPVMERMAKAVKAEDTRAYLAEDSNFHLAIVRSAQNSFLEAANNLISSKMSAIRTVLGKDRDMFSGSWNTHQEIFKLITNGDSKAATARLEKHILDGKVLFADL